jgi:ribonuclease D
MHPYTLIDTDTAFRRWYESLPSERLAIAVDIEAEFNLHIYGEHFCLLQVYDGVDALAIDPQTVSIGLIKGFLESRDRLKITYDSASDRALLYKNHGILMSSILDLRPAVSLLGLQKQGLGAVLEEILGIEPPRDKQKYQQYNWTRRPIDDGAMAYAIDDVVHLFRLREELLSRINEAGLTDRYLLDNFAVQDRVPETDRKPGMLRDGRFRRLSPDRQELLEQLHAEREAVAREVNLPPNTVYPNRALLAIVMDGRSPEGVRPSRGMPAEPFNALVQRLVQVSSGR